MTVQIPEPATEEHLAKVLQRRRREISDTARDDPLLSDEEIAYAYSEEGSILAAASRCAGGIASSRRCNEV